MRHPFPRALTALAAVAALTTCASAFAFTPPPFPRIAGIQVGGPFDYNDPSYQAQLAKQSIMVLNYWPGMAPGGESMDSIIRAIKAKNPNALVFLYVDMDALIPTGNQSLLRAKVNTMRWWLYSGTGFTNPVPSWYGNGNYTINSTLHTAKDANGNNAVDWITKYIANSYYKPNPDIDGIFMDNVFQRPRVAGDWYNNGVVLQPSDPKAAAALQGGYERYFSLIRQLMPGKYQIGNVGTWYRPGQAGAVPPGYQGMVDGGEIEGLIGKSWSTETWAGWRAMEKQYYSVMSAIRAPKLAIFNQWGNSTDYQSMRYGLASCLMNNGYYSFTSSAAKYSGVVWFDEYSANLGMPTSPPPTGPWQKGVWRRDFTNGIALVNPKGNGPQTVQLGGTFVKIKGAQDPAVNNGQTVTSVTLRNRDGIILLRQTPLEQPKAPTDVTAGTD